jgi:hypothetical protein
MKKTILVVTMLAGVLCQSTFAVGIDVPEVGSTLGLLSLAVAGVTAMSWKRKK